VSTGFARLAPDRSVSQTGEAGRHQAGKVTHVLPPAQQEGHREHEPPGARDGEDARPAGSGSHSRLAVGRPDVALLKIARAQRWIALRRRTVPATAREEHLDQIPRL